MSSKGLFGKLLGTCGKASDPPEASGPPADDRVPPAPPSGPPPSRPPSRPPSTSPVEPPDRRVEDLRSSAAARPAPERPAPPPASERPVPERPAPERSVPERSVPERSVPERSAPERPAPERSAPPLPVPEAVVPEAVVPEADVDLVDVDLELDDDGFDLTAYLSDGLPDADVEVLPNLDSIQIMARPEDDEDGYADDDYADEVVVPAYPYGDYDLRTPEEPEGEEAYEEDSYAEEAYEETYPEACEETYAEDEPEYAGGSHFGDGLSELTLTREEEPEEAPWSPPPEEALEEAPEAAAPPQVRHAPLPSEEVVREVDGMKDRVVGRLLRQGIVTPAQVKAALKEQQQNRLTATLWRILAQRTDVDRERIYREAARTYAFAEAKLDQEAVDLEFARKVANAFSEERRNRMIELRLLPIGYDFEPQTQLLRMVFITHDPGLPAVREFVQGLKLERFQLQYASEDAVRALIAEAFPKKNEYLERMSADPLAYDLGANFEEDDDLLDEEALEAEINRSSLINLFEATLVEAVRMGASDIHIYPNERRQIEIHFRVDGRLQRWHTEEKVHPEAMLAIIKDNSTNVDRFERDAAQDGFIQRRVDDALIRFRVSILPIASPLQDIRSESIVIRVLDDRKVITDLAKLGLLEGAQKRFDMAIHQPHGMVILTGPTGSGKSTTLVAALHQVVTPEVNVLTVEDPVEYIIRGVRQIKLNHKLGLEQAIRAILRHDPDIVMVGEMRDRPTAELAIKLANTGHLTFSTLHTNDAPSAVSRLYKMGIEPFLIAYAINMVVAQRLIRRLCPECKHVDDDPDHVLLEQLGFDDDEVANTTFYIQGEEPHCKTCRGVGYKGRRAITEALYFSREIRHMIVESDRAIDEERIRQQARKEGMLTLEDSARELVKMGDTSVQEMMRVTMSEG